MGKKQRGKRDGTGPYKASPRKTGVRKARGEKCPPIGRTGSKKKSLLMKKKQMQQNKKK